MKSLTIALLLILSVLLKAQSITVTYPNGGEHLQQGKIKAITWSTTGVVGNVMLEYTTDNGASWVQIISSTANTGSYDWLVPLSTTTDQAFIRISDVSVSSAYDISNAAFSIINLDLTGPDGGEHIQAGKAFTIQWNCSTNLASVDLTYTSDDGGSWNVIAGGVNASLHSYSWNVPANISSNQCKVKVADAASSLVNDLSSSAFSIVNVALTAPVGGERIQAGKPYTITWTSTAFLANVKLEYSTDNGATYNQITASAPAIGQSYIWNVPPGIGYSQCKIRISDAASASVKDISPAAFSILNLTLTSPIGSESLQEGKSFNITWVSSANLNNVDLSYTTDNGANWNLLAGGVAAPAHSYSWTVPAGISTDQCKIKMTDAFPSSVTDQSPNLFSIKRLSLTAPNGGEYIKEGGTYNITWSASSNLTNVKLEYSTNNGTSWSTIQASVSAAAGTYSWSVPTNISTDQALVRVSDQSASSVSDNSNASFHIMSLELTSPNGGEHIQAGNTFNITWSNSTNLAQIDLAYSVDNGLSWTPIPGAQNLNSSLHVYTWNVPAGIFSDQCKIKISGSATTSAITDISSNNFSIVSFAITDPNGGEQMQVGKVYSVKWTSSNNLSNVKLEYTTNNGTSWNLIAASVSASLGIYAWTVPNTPSTGCRVRISEVTNPANYVISNAVFTISSINVTYPNGSESFLDGSSVMITWNAQNVANVKIDYSINGGASFNPVAGSVSASSGSYSWNVPGGLSNSNCIIQVSDAGNANVKDQSDGPFTVSNLALTAPLAAVNWQSGQVKNITWTSAFVSNVKIEYSSNNGTSWSVVTASTAAATGQYAWTVPNTNSLNSLTQCLIRISDQAFPANSRQSAAFTISPVQALQVSSPDGLENWQENSQHNISWTATDNIANVVLEYTTNNGTSWLPIGGPRAANLSPYLWTLPAGTSSTQCRIRVSNAVDLSVNDISDNLFTISSLRVTSPNAGTERWQSGKSYNITWNSQNIGNVKLEYSTDNKLTWTIIANSVPADQASYSWLIPNLPSTVCFIRISDVAHSEILDLSDAAFAITALALSSPNGGENWLEGSAHAITWTSANIANVALEYSSDNEATWQTIIASTPAAAGTYMWTLPGVTTNNYKIRIKDASAASINDISDNTFVVSSLNLTSPIGGEVWKVGTAHDITWTCSNTISNVKIEYTTNNGSEWITVASSILAGSSPYRWITPNTTSAFCRVRVSSVGSPGVNSFSQAYFTIDKNVIVTLPNGSESWEIGSLHNITWQSDPGVTAVKLEYSTDSGNTWLVINSPVDATLHTYSWQVPNTPSANCLVRITDIANATNYDQSDAKFSIISTPSITVTRPNGGEIFETGAQEAITWTSKNVNFVRIEYSINNGTSWNLIQSGVASTGSYTWNVPNLKSTQCRIRITDESNATNTDLSDDKFTVNARIVVTSPNGGESIPVASTYPVSWTSTNVANVKIEYSTDNGSSWLTVTSSVAAAAGTYNWIVPNTPASGCLLRISDASKPEVFDASDATFAISSKILLMSPNGGECWQAGSQHDIKWSSNNVTNVSIAYSLDAGQTWTSIVASTAASAGTYKWTLPINISTTQGRIKVSDASNANVFDVSDNLFSVSILVLKTPAGGESFAIGSKQTITWSSTNVSFINLDYSIDNGLSWKSITTYQPSNGIYYWEIPATASTQCLVRISDPNNTGTYDISNAIFSITESPSVTVLYPLGGESFRIGTTEVLKWKSSNVNNVKLEYSVNNGSDWKLIASTVPSTGTYSWVIPAENSSLCKFRVSDASRPAIYDASPLAFAIAASPKVTVVAPNGGENYPVGSVQKISWTSNNVSSVKLEYSINNGIDWSTIISSCPSSGVYTWTVPATASSQCKIKISDTTNIGTYDLSDNNFTISEAPVITVLYPNAKEKLTSGSKEIIKWKSASVNNVKIEYSLNNGSDWSLVVSSAPSTGSYIWLLPNVTSNLCKIKISDVTKPEVYDMSDSVFAISNLPKVTVTSPNGDETYQVGSTQLIKWTSSSISNVKLEYSINNGIDWFLIEEAYPSSGTYNWIVPNTASNQCLVKISDASNSLTSDLSDRVFLIVPNPQIHLTAPNGKEVWEIGKTQYITWTSVNVKNVKIELTTNNGSSWSALAANAVNTGSYTWVVPNMSSVLCKIRVSDVLSALTNDASDSVFIIVASPKISVTSPNGGEAFKTGSQRNITWSSSDVENVKIEYSINNGVSWKTVAEAVPSTGSYIWTVPETPSLQCKIKISDASSPETVDQSDNVFVIAKLELLRPVADDVLLTGDAYAVTWKSECIGNVKIEYSVDKGATWIQIVASTSALSGTYNWSVPTAPIPQCLVKISDASNSSVYDIVDNVFSTQQIIVLSPAENVQWKMGVAQTIMWKTFNVTNVKIEYSIDNGSKWEIISSAVLAKLGSYNWIVPKTPSDFCIVRISDASNQQTFSTNKDVFTINDLTGVESLSDIKPDNFELFQNHPNPFNPSTKIRYQLPEAAFVVLKVYDAMGKEVCTLVDNEQSAGVYETTFNAQSLANGVYIYRLQAGSNVATKKLILMK